MPTYQYACTNAEGKHEFEVVQSFSDPSLTECVECGAPVRKVYGSVGVVFKGSGFYRTDSRKISSASESAGNGSSAGASAPAAAKEGSSGKESSGKENSSSKTGSSTTSTTSGSGAKAAN